METPEPPTPELSWDVLDRYFAGDCSSAEGRIVQEYLAQDPRAEQMLRYASRLPERTAIAPSVDKGWTALIEQLNGELTQGSQVAPSGVHPQPQTSWGNGSAKELRWGSRVPRFGTHTPRRIMAVIGSAGTIAAIALFFLMRHVSTPVPTSDRMYTTDDSHRAAVTLSDGTQLMLAPGTALRVANIDGHERSVRLERGEAYFDVRSAVGAPFAVRVGAATATVLGTKFLIRRGFDDAVRIGVTTGKVRVTAYGAARTLVSGNVFRMRDSTIDVSTIGQTDADDRLPFNDVRVNEVLAALTRWYGYSFKCDDSSLVNRNVTVWLSTRSSADALATLRRILKVNFHVAGDTITLVPRRDNIRATPRSGGYDIWTPGREVGR